MLNVLFSCQPETEESSAPDGPWNEVSKGLIYPSLEAP